MFESLVLAGIAWAIWFFGPAIGLKEGQIVLLDAIVLFLAVCFAYAWARQRGHHKAQQSVDYDKNHGSREWKKSGGKGMPGFEGSIGWKDPTNSNRHGITNNNKW